MQSERKTEPTYWYIRVAFLDSPYERESDAKAP